MEKKHRLFLSMYSFHIKKINTSNTELIDNNEFLSKAYPDIEEDSFTNGFVQDIINLFDLKLFKNKAETHGGILEEKSVNKSERIFDLMINGGTKGIKQYIIDESREKAEIAEKDIVGLKFFARIWLPANTKTGYLFIQRYNSASLKPLFDEIVFETLKKHDFIFVGRRTQKTTTQKRQNEFLKEASIKEISVFVNESDHDTGSPEAHSAVIRISRLKYIKKAIDKTFVQQLLQKNKIEIAGDYTFKAKYSYKENGYEEEKTIKMDEDETITFVPNIPIPFSCIDANNHPIFTEMQTFINKEMTVLKREAKMK